MTNFQTRVIYTAFQMGILASAGVLAFCNQGWTTVHGGPGGDAFKVFCPPETFVVGLTGRAGHIIEKMQLVCAGFTKTEEGKNFQPKASFVQGAIMGAGTGGEAANSKCPAGFVKEIRYNTRIFHDARVIEHIRLECRDLKLTSSTQLFGKIENTQNEFIENCPGTNFLIGFEGRVGLFVDAIGPVCAPMP